MSNQSVASSRDVRRRRQLSPTARHFAALAIYYVLAAFAIGAVDRALPPRTSVEATTEVPAASSAAENKASGPFASFSTATGLNANRARNILRTMVAMLGALALALPVSWVYLITRRKKGFTQSVMHTLLVLPIAVAGIMVLVQNSLALAFSLAGLAALRFRNTLDDTKDTVYLFVATGIGIAAAVDQLDVGLALSLIFSVVVLVLWWTDIGREPSRLKAELTLQELRHTMEMRVATMEHRVPVAIPPSAQSSLNAILRVHTTSVESAQGTVEEVLAGAAKQWELTGVTPGEEGRSMLDYVVRLRAKTQRADVLNDLRTRGTPHVIGAEYR
jgi:hypothetical protein